MNGTGSSLIDRHARQLAAVVGVAAFVSYLWRAAPTTWLLDSGELVATTARMSISHPPGHPAFALAGALALLIPVGNAAFRMHLFCAACAAATVALVPLVLHRLGALRSRAGLLLAAAVSMAAALSPAFSFQAIRAEVYALEALSLAVATWAICEPGARISRRSAGVAAVALATGLLNHHYVTFFAFPAFAGVIVARSGGWRAAAQNVGLGVVMGAVGLLGYAYLLAASASAPWPSWRWVTGVDALVWTISAQAFQKALGAAQSIDPVAGVQSALGLLAVQATPIGLLAVVGGVAALTSGARALAVFFVMALAGNLLTQVLFDFDPHNPDVWGYFMFSVFICAVLGGAVGLLEARGSARPTRLVLSTLAATIGLLALLQSEGGARPTLARDRSAETLLDAQIGSMPPRSAWVTTYFETLFYMWYGQVIEDRRPDLVVLHRAWRTYPDFDAMFASRWPTESDALGVPGTAGAIDERWLERRAAAGGLLIEAETLVRDEEVADAGVTVLGFGRGLDTLDATRFEREATALAARLETETNVQAARILLWAHYHQARLLMAGGRTELALVAARRALAMSPTDPDLAVLIEQIEAIRAREP